MARVVSFPRRGEVYWVAFDPTVGTEIRKTRPAVVVSNDALNEHGRRIVVVPITSKVERRTPSDAAVRVLGRAGVALGDQLRSIDRRRLCGCIGALSAAEFEGLIEALRILLVLPLF